MSRRISDRATHALGLGDTWLSVVAPVAEDYDITDIDGATAAYRAAVAAQMPDWITIVGESIYCSADVDEDLDGLRRLAADIDLDRILAAYAQGGILPPSDRSRRVWLGRLEKYAQVLGVDDARVTLTGGENPRDVGGATGGHMDGLGVRVAIPWPITWAEADGLIRQLRNKARVRDWLAQGCGLPRKGTAHG